MATWHNGYLGDELYERLSPQLLDLLRVETGQVVGLRLPLSFAAAVERPVFWPKENSISRGARPGRQIQNRQKLSGGKTRPGVSLCSGSFVAHPLEHKPLRVGPRLTQQVFEQRLVLLPDAVEGGPARTPVRQRVLPDPASAGELVEVLAGVGAAVHGLHHLTGHRHTGLRQAQASTGVCKATRDNRNKTDAHKTKRETKEGKEESGRSNEVKDVGKGYETFEEDGCG